VISAQGAELWPSDELGQFGKNVADLLPLLFVNELEATLVAAR
jgi:hypothetical protein